MNFRQFVEQTKDAVHAIAGDVGGERTLTPMLHLESEAGVHLMPVDPRFFDSIETRQRLVQGFVIPLVREHAAFRVAWTFEAWATARDGVRASEADDRHELVVGTFIDRERVEVWQARIHRPPAGVPFVGQWEAWEPEATDGPLLITPIQEAMR